MEKKDNDYLKELLERARKLRPKNPKKPDYTCPICKDLGAVRVVIDGVEYWKNCSCVKDRINADRIKKSGLEALWEQCGFEKFQTTERWQERIKKLAVEYSRNPNGWFFIGGCSGCGKTHLCTAICKELIKSGRLVRYMMWVDENTCLKAKRNSDEYGQLIQQWKDADVLYIDDFFKTIRGTEVTAADVMTAYEILNYRCNQAGSITIISSELSCDDILEIDSAVGGRIYQRVERQNMIFLGRGNEKNYRLRR